MSGIDVILKLSYDGRRAIDHDQAEADKHGDCEEQNPVCLKTLSHFEKPLD